MIAYGTYGSGISLISSVNRKNIVSSVPNIEYDLSPIQTSYVIQIEIEPDEDPVRRKIRTFGKLPKGWDFGVGTHAAPATMRRALDIQSLGPCLQLKTNAFPGAGGEISITFYCGEDSVDVTVNPCGTYTITHERGIGVDYEEVAYKEHATLATVLRFLKKLSCAGWKSSEDFMQVSTTPISSDFEAMLSRTSGAGSR